MGCSDRCGNLDEGLFNELALRYGTPGNSKVRYCFVMVLEDSRVADGGRAWTEASKKKVTFMWAEKETVVQYELAPAPVG